MSFGLPCCAPFRNNNLTGRERSRARDASAKGRRFVANRRVKKGGEKVEEAEYHNIVVFGRQAESCAQYLKKGSVAHVEGRIQTRSYDKDGAKMYRTEIVGDRIQFGPRPGAVNGPVKDVAAEDTDQRPPSERGAGEATASAGPIPYPEEDINPDDIPF